MTTAELLIDSLCEMGCQPELKEGNTVFFKFQGEMFSANVNKRFLRIWDLPFARVHMLDLNLPLVMEVINRVNFGLGPVVVLAKPDSNGERDIASRMDILFCSDISQPCEYLEAILLMFFETKRKLEDEFCRLIGKSDSSQSSTLTSFSHRQN